MLTAVLAYSCGAGDNNGKDSSHENCLRRRPLVGRYLRGEFVAANDRYVGSSAIGGQSPQVLRLACLSVKMVAASASNFFKPLRGMNVTVGTPEGRANFST